MRIIMTVCSKTEGDGSTMLKSVVHDNASIDSLEAVLCADGYNQPFLHFEYDEFLQEAADMVGAPPARTIGGDS